MKWQSPLSRTARKSPSRQHRWKFYTPALEALEDRVTPTTLLPGFSETTVTTGLSGPTAMDFSPDGRLWVLEQGGRVKLVHNDGTTFTALTLTTDSAGERGLLGIAFDPNFASNHYVYLYYTNPGAGGAAWASGEHNQISRFTVNDTNPLQPTFTSEAPILDLNSLVSVTNHNGGAIHFGLDGMLYADTGDNTQTFVGPDNNTYRVSQSLATLLGKQLRINVAAFNSGTATRDDTTVGHLIPSNNPFVGKATGINQLVYALGLRNPYTFAVQPGTGRILINDVGENTWEEIDDSIAGGNYGWSGGNTDGFGHPPPSFAAGTYHDPLLAYTHSGSASLATGIAIVGGTFYNPTTVEFPSSYVGMYFYEDLGSGWIRYFNPNTPNSASSPDGNSVAFASGTPGGLRDLKVDAAGNLYYLSGGDGSLRKISYQASQAPQITGQPTNQTVNQGQTATFSVTATGPSLSYQWQHLVGTTWTDVGTSAATFTIASVQTSDAGSYRVVVSNSAGSVTSNTASLTVTQSTATIRIEAESLRLSHYVIEANASASGGKEISLNNGGPTPQTGTATGTFSGPSGLYIVTAGDYDENDGVSTMAVKFGTGPAVTWKLNVNLPSSLPDATTHTTHLVGVIPLTHGETFVLTGTSNGSEFARWDYLDFKPASLVTAVNAGGPATGSFLADTDFSGGGTGSTTHPINLSGVYDPAPMAVYQTWRNNAPTYTIPNLTPGASYVVRLHFAEDVATGPGQRVQNVFLNGKKVLSNFDIYALVGPFKALVEEFTVTADSSGKITVGFQTVKGTTRVSAIEVVDPPAAGTPGR